MKTRFIDTTKGEKPKKETVFTHSAHISSGWEATCRTPSDFEEIKYLGRCKEDGDMFAGVNVGGHIYIFKGTKGSEFD